MRFCPQALRGRGVRCVLVPLLSRPRRNTDRSRGKIPPHESTSPRVGDDCVQGYSSPRSFRGDHDRSPLTSSAASRVRKWAWTSSGMPDRHHSVRTTHPNRSTTTITPLWGAMGLPPGLGAGAQQILPERLVGPALRRRFPNHLFQPVSRVLRSGKASGKQVRFSPSQPPNRSGWEVKGSAESLADPHSPCAEVASEDFTNDGNSRGPTTPLSRPPLRVAPPDLGA